MLRATPLRSAVVRISAFQPTSLHSSGPHLAELHETALHRVVGRVLFCSDLCSRDLTCAFGRVLSVERSDYCAGYCRWWNARVALRAWTGARVRPESYVSRETIVSSLPRNGSRFPWRGYGWHPGTPSDGGALRADNQIMAPRSGTVCSRRGGAAEHNWNFHSGHRGGTGQAAALPCYR